MTIDEAINRVEQAIRERVACGFKPTTIVCDKDTIRVQFATGLPWGATDEDQYTVDEFRQLVEDAVEYADKFDEPEFDTALEQAGLSLGYDE